MFASYFLNKLIDDEEEEIKAKHRLRYAEHLHCFASHAVFPSRRISVSENSSSTAMSHEGVTVQDVSFTTAKFLLSLLHRRRTSHVNVGRKKRIRSAGYVKYSCNISRKLSAGRDHMCGNRSSQRGRRRETFQVNGR